jgi:hypothetical protein
MSEFDGQGRFRTTALQTEWAGKFTALDRELDWIGTRFNVSATYLLFGHHYKKVHVFQVNRLADIQIEQGVIHRKVDNGQIEQGEIHKKVDDAQIEQGVIHKKVDDARIAASVQYLLC